MERVQFGGHLESLKVVYLAEYQEDANWRFRRATRGRAEYFRM